MYGCIERDGGRHFNDANAIALRYVRDERSRKILYKRLKKNNNFDRFPVVAVKSAEYKKKCRMTREKNHPCNF